jgi:hypothetical protein
MNSNNCTLGIEPVLQRLRLRIDRTEKPAARSPGRGAAQIVEDILAHVESNRVVASTGGRA